MNRGLPTGKLNPGTKDGGNYTESERHNSDNRNPIGESLATPFVELAVSTCRNIYLPNGGLQLSLTRLLAYSLRDFRQKVAYVSPHDRGVTKGA